MHVWHVSFAFFLLRLRWVRASPRCSLLFVRNICPVCGWSNSQQIFLGVLYDGEYPFWFLDSVGLMVWGLPLPWRWITFELNVVQKGKAHQAWGKQLLLQGAPCAWTCCRAFGPTRRMAFFGSFGGDLEFLQWLDPRSARHLADRLELCSRQGIAWNYIEDRTLETFALVASSHWSSWCWHCKIWSSKMQGDVSIHWVLMLNMCEIRHCFSQCLFALM